MTVVRLALADLWHERIILLCNLALVVGVVGPLLILLGLKVGIMSVLFGELRDDPENLYISIQGDQALSSKELSQMATWKEVGFSAPATRSITRRLFIKNEGGRRIERVALLPSGLGDPLVPSGPPTVKARQVAVSASLASRLGIEVGARLQASITRGQPPSARLMLELTVIRVLAEGHLHGSALLIDPLIMDDVEAFLDDYALPTYGVMDGRKLSDRDVVFENVRLYARSLDDVQPLVARLEQEMGFEVRSHVAKIARIQSLDRNLTLALSVIIVAAVLGLFLALVAAFWSNTKRKYRELSIIRLLGATTRTLACFPLVQALVLASVGFAIALCAYTVGASVINYIFSGVVHVDQPVCQLPTVHKAIVAVALLVLSGLAATLSGLVASRADPACALREAI